MLYTLQRKSVFLWIQYIVVDLSQSIWTGWQENRDTCCATMNCTVTIALWYIVLYSTHPLPVQIEKDDMQGIYLLVTGHCRTYFTVYKRCTVDLGELAILDQRTWHCCDLSNMTTAQQLGTCSYFYNAAVRCVFHYINTLLSQFSLSVKMPKSWNCCYLYDHCVVLKYYPNLESILGEASIKNPSSFYY